MTFDSGFSQGIVEGAVDGCHEIVEIEGGGSGHDPSPGVSPVRGIVRNPLKNEDLPERKPVQCISYVPLAELYMPLSNALSPSE